MPKVLFIATHRPNRSPSQRFRFEQYLNFLKESGWDYDFSYLISATDDKYFYKNGYFLRKLWIIFKSTFKRIFNLLRLSQYDLVFIQREAFLTGSTFFEKQLSKAKPKLIFDFDDSIWLSNVSDANKKWNWLKNPDKTKKIIALADLVFAGNNYLASYARQFNENVVIIPTTIDLGVYKAEKKEPSDKITIGWSGSITTIQHFEYAIESLSIIKKQYGNKITIKVIGDANYKNVALDIQGLAWKAEDEIKELSSFDIGIMPLPNDEWAKGKCGLKGLQYMALGVPTIMSPVGVNSDIIQDAENGFLASTTEEWVEKLSALIESQSLRKQIGEAGLKTVKEKYSVEANKQKYLDCFNQLIND